MSTITQPPRRAIWSLRSRLNNSISESLQYAAKVAQMAAMVAEAARTNGALTRAAAKSLEDDQAFDQTIHQLLGMRPTRPRKPAG